MADLSYDEALKGKDFVYEAGIKWDTNDTAEMPTPPSDDL